MKSFKLWRDIVFTLAIVSFLILFFSGCSASRIIDAKPARLVSYEKQEHSTFFTVTLMAADSCTQYVSRWDSRCWRCRDADVPQLWNIKTYRNKKSFSEPLK